MKAARLQMRMLGVGLVGGVLERYAVLRARSDIEYR
jgi:hypothetical protein